MKEAKNAQRLVAERLIDGNKKTLGGAALIQEVIVFGCYDLIQQMLEHCDDLDVNAEFDGQNALHEAIQCYRYGIAQLLLTNSSIDVNKRNGHGCPPIVAAVRAGQVELVQTMIDSRDDLDVNAEHCGRTALYEAFEKEKLDIIKVLISHPRTNLNVTNSKGRPLLHAAIAKGWHDIRDQLLNKSTYLILVYHFYSNFSFNSKFYSILSYVKGQVIEFDCKVLN